MSGPESSSNLRHELRTPLNQIIGYTEMLLEEAQDRNQADFIPDLQRIHTAGWRLLGVIDDLFDSAKAPAENEAFLHHELRTPLNQIIGYTEMLQDVANDRGEASFPGDFDKIHRAARQLLDLLIERVIGLENKRDQPGPEPSLATFTRPEASAVPQLDPQAKPGRPEAQSGTLLVVDDNEANRDMLARRLERLGYKVSRAVNGREALEKISREPFDLVLLDIMMPEMNGYEVLERLKADAALRSLPVIVLSASDESQSVVRCIQMGAEDHLRKPFDPVLLQARISACLEKKRFRDREVSYLRQIQEEKQRSDDLLHIILPPDVAAELKSTSAVHPRRFDGVGVLFCDIADFTAFSERQQPEIILAHLQRLVEAFEQIAARHELEKIKTIGDAFMATAGLRMPLTNPALNCVRCGL